MLIPLLTQEEKKHFMNDFGSNFTQYCPKILKQKQLPVHNSGFRVLLIAVSSSRS